MLSALSKDHLARQKTATYREGQIHRQAPRRNQIKPQPFSTMGIFQTRWNHQLEYIAPPFIRKTVSRKHPISTRRLRNITTTQGRQHLEKRSEHLRLNSYFQKITFLYPYQEDHGAGYRNVHMNHARLFFLYLTLQFHRKGEEWLFCAR